MQVLVVQLEDHLAVVRACEVHDERRVAVGEDAEGREREGVVGDDAFEFEPAVGQVCPKQHPSLTRRPMSASARRQRCMHRPRAQRQRRLWAVIGRS
eukprot:1410811-Prymnesium_polylepis.1